MSNAEKVIDTFVSTQPGQPYRLLPFGVIKRASGGPSRNFTPEMAARFKLPHFQPPIKLGSHEDATAAGGHITSLFVRNEGNAKTDGLWAVPVLTEKGAKSWGEGDYKYHSPEIIWEGGGLEDATTGTFIDGPLIVGDALLHVPALGEATALYTSQVKTGENMSEETMVQVPKGFLDQLMAFFKPTADPVKPEPQKPVEQPAVTDEYKAAVKERDDFKAKLETLEAERLHATRVTELAAELKKTERFSATFKDEKAANDAAEKLAALPKESQEWVMQQLAALSKRIDYSKLTAELGSDATTAIADPRQAFAAAVDAKVKTGKISYTDAYVIVKDEAPELFAAYANHKPKGD
jgi:Mu-like prophage I protein.